LVGLGGFNAVLNRMVFFILVVVSSTHPFIFVDDCVLSLPTLPPSQIYIL